MDGMEMVLRIELAHPAGANAVEGVHLDANALPDRDYVVEMTRNDSVQGGGVEFVTRSAPLAVHLANLPALQRLVESAGFFADCSCGLRVYTRGSMEGAHTPSTKTRLTQFTLGEGSTVEWDRLVWRTWGTAARQDRRPVPPGVRARL